MPILHGLQHIEGYPKIAMQTYLQTMESLEAVFATSLPSVYQFECAIPGR